MSKAIFLGSFNPPHKGHLNCILSVIYSGCMKRLGIDKIHIIPCYQNPNKEAYDVSFIDRYIMCSRMFKDLIIEDKVVIDDIENIEQINYTCDLIRFFKSNKDNLIKDDFWWIITEETYLELLHSKWKDSTYLLNKNNFIIVYENEYSDVCLKSTTAEHVPLIKKIDYHSTQLREKVKNGEDIINETNENVQNYIDDEKLYYQIK